MQQVNSEQALQNIQRLTDNIETVIKGKRNQITMGEITYKLDDLFFTIATQNPVEMEGTYPLPAAQLDRFFIKIIFGYVDEETELEIYKDYLGINNNLMNIQQVLGINEILF